MCFIFTGELNSLLVALNSLLAMMCHEPNAHLFILSMNTHSIITIPISISHNGNTAHQESHIPYDWSLNPWATRQEDSFNLPRY